MLPILGVAPDADKAAAREHARQLGFAFQLTNFIRDVGEDVERGRVYLPEEDMDRFGVTRRMLTADSIRSEASRPIRDLIQYECRRALDHYAAARPGISMLEPRSRLCIRAAYLLYGGILEEVARAGYDVMRARARVPRHRRVAIVGAAASGTLFEIWTQRLGLRE
jgi:15-cis-phytoene synthase